ncbi:hypothetical protein GCM10010449_41940 [Streptomyces rectiviolaceus]|uniref:Uncharacterized protein n=1 Tax=Streptomyces rectiviolaceus TaxID=332591 RepID=A0ABP6MII0_9ACTN
MHAAVPEAREDACRYVQQAHEGAGAGDEGGHGLGAWAAEQSAESAVAAVTEPAGTAPTFGAAALTVRNRT